MASQHRRRCKPIRSTDPPDPENDSGREPLHDASAGLKSQLIEYEVKVKIGQSPDVIATPVFSQRRDSYLISSDRSLLSLSSISNALADPRCGSPKNYSPAVLEKILSESFCLGLYRTTNPTTSQSRLFKQVGFTRLLTDFVTFTIIADVYVLPEERGKGLGRWLLQCADDVAKNMDTTLRRAILFSNEGPLEQFYEKELGMTRWGPESVGGLVMMHREGQASGVGKH
ncbi:MAG: hypothetical protein Q9221_008566 [Calogaya cf. arnoldii]